MGAMRGVLSLPKRLRYFLYHEPALIGPVSRIFLERVEGPTQGLKSWRIRGRPVRGVTFVHRFGSALNR